MMANDALDFLFVVFKFYIMVFLKKEKQKNLRIILVGTKKGPFNININQQRTVGAQSDPTQHSPEAQHTHTHTRFTRTESCIICSPSPQWLHAGRWSVRPVWLL